MATTTPETQNLLLQAQPGEIPVGTYDYTDTVQGVALSFPLWMFVNIDRQTDQLVLHARVVGDLSDLQRKVGSLVDTIPLPTNTCDHHGADNVVARIWGKQLTVDGNVASLKLNGDIDVWLCTPLIKTRLVNQPFDATLPFQLAVADPHTIGLTMGTPAVTLGGAAAPILRIAGVDINGKVKEMLDKAINLDALRKPLPPEVMALNPTITHAELFSNAGALAASVSMQATVTLAQVGTILLALHLPAAA